MKGQQPVAVAGRAFGKDGDHVAIAQGFRHVMHHAHRIPPSFALDVERAGTRRQGADHRPVADHRLGDESHMPRRMDREDVQPRQVIAHQQQRTMGRGGAKHRQADPHQVEHALGPLLHTLLTLRGRQARETGSNGPPARCDMRHGAQQPEAGGEGLHPGGCLGAQPWTTRPPTSVKRARPSMA